MTGDFSQIKWVRVVLTAVVVCIVSILAVILIVTAYATVLGFQARGAPDQAMIDAFVNQYTPGLSAITMILFSLLGALHVGKRVQDAVQLHGLVLGVVTGVLNLVLGGSFDILALITTALIVGAGWLGGRMAASRK